MLIYIRQSGNHSYSHDDYEGLTLDLEPVTRDDNPDYAFVYALPNRQERDVHDDISFAFDDIILEESGPDGPSHAITFRMEE